MKKLHKYRFYFIALIGLAIMLVGLYLTSVLGLVLWLVGIVIFLLALIFHIINYVKIRA